MDDLRKKFKGLREKIQSRKLIDRKLRVGINDALAAVFGEMAGQAGEFHLKNGILFFKAKNKVYANELFLRKEELKKILKNNPEVRDIVVR